MGIISGIWEKRSTLSNPSRWLVDALAGGGASKAGVTVNEETALTHTAVFACVRILSETVASLPLFLYRRLPEGGKEKATSHPLFSILHDAPNTEMTSFQFRETMMAHLLLWGNAYAEIEFNAAGHVQALWPIGPWRVSVERGPSGFLQYRVNVDTDGDVERIRVLPADQVLHIPGLSFNGLVGLSPIAAARESIGLGLAAQEFGARFFGNGAQLGGVLEHPKTLSEEAHKHLKASFDQQYSGLDKTHRLLILEEGMKYTRIGIPPEDAQFLETRKFQVTEIARFFRVPPHMLADLERATFSNIEQQSIDFVMHSIRPWLVRWEQAMKQKLLGREGRRQFFPEFLVDGLLRGDIKSRYEAYAIARQNGWMSADDIRELENMNPLPGGQGKTYLIPANMLPADQAGREPEGEQEATGEGAAGEQEERSQRSEWEERAMRSAQRRHQVAQSHKRLFRDAVARVVRREVNDIRKAARSFLARRNLADFNQWLIDFYNEHPDFMEKNMLPVFLAYAELVQGVAAEEIGISAGLTPEMEEFVRAYVANFITRHTGSSLAQLQTVVREAQAAGEDPLAAIEQRLDEWEEKRPDKVADREVIQASNAIALATYTTGGVLYKRWNAIGKDCPYCRRLDGKVVGVAQSFIEEGQDYQPEGAETPLRPRYNIGHPPLHRGCDCMITASI